MKKIIRLYTFLAIIFCLAACGKSVEAQIAEQLELGQKYQAELNYEEAIVAFNKVIELDAKNIPAYTGLGQVYEAQAEAAAEAEDREDFLKYYDMAAEMYEKVQELDPTDTESAERLTIIYTELGYLERLEKILERFSDTENHENLTASIEMIRELQGLLDAENFEEIYKLLDEEKFSLLRETILKDGIWIIELENGKGLGFYPFKETYMVYYGDYVDGKREGSGIWVATEGHEYRSIGEWQNDVPNGHHVLTQKSGSFSGTVVDGLWDGTVIRESFQAGFVVETQIINGKYVIIDEEEGANGETVYVVGKDGNISYTPSNYDKLQGIRGFVPES